MFWSKLVEVLVPTRSTPYCFWESCFAGCVEACETWGSTIVFQWPYYLIRWIVAGHFQWVDTICSKSLLVKKIKFGQCPTGEGGGKVQWLNLPKLTFFSQTNIPFKKGDRAVVNLYSRNNFLCLFVWSCPFLAIQDFQQFPALLGKSINSQPCLAIPARSS